MSAGLPKRFDPQRLAAQAGGAGGSLEGETDTTVMPRLSEALATDRPARVEYALQAYRDDSRRLVIEGRASAMLDCECQRCMEPVSLPVATEFSLAVVRDEEAAKHLPAELDPLLMDRDTEIDLAGLLEDELILALPQIPMHEDAAECGERAKYGQPADEEFDTDAKRENPFAVLKKLKNGNN